MQVDLWIEKNGVNCTVYSADRCGASATFVHLIRVITIRPKNKKCPPAFAFSKQLGKRLATTNAPIFKI